MSFKFTPEMFSHEFSTYHRERMARSAQAALDAHVASLPVVYSSDLYWGEFRRDTDRRSAVLFNAQEIAPKDCNHKPEVNAFNLFRCIHCKKPLKAKWEVCE